MTNFFESIGKARNELVHTMMLEWILTSEELITNPSESPFIHFLDAVISRDMQQCAWLRRNYHFIPAIDTRSLKIKKLVSREVEYPLGAYAHDPTSNCVGFKTKKQELISAKEKDRIDLYLKFEITGLRRRKVEIFLENKVYSEQRDNQTQRYYEVCKQNTANEKNVSYKIFVYLTPLSSSQLEDFAYLDKGENRAMCDCYIQINYQDIMDYVITPLLSDTQINDKARFLLEEYVRCLESPALPDGDAPSAPKGLSVMATRNQ